jgi:hypothetical protein
VFQRQIVRLLEAHGREWVVIVAPVARDTLWTFSDALAYNFAAAVGVLAIDAGFYVVRHALALATLDFDAFDEAMELVAFEAARLRRGLEEPTSVAHLHYVD